MFPLPLFLLGLAGATNVASGMAMNRAAYDNEKLRPEIGGYDVRVPTGLVGFGMAVLGGPWLAAVGVGLVTAAILNYDSTELVKEGLTKFLEAEKKKAAIPTMPAPPQLPPPAPPPMPPIQTQPQPAPAQAPNQTPFPLVNDLLNLFS